MDIIEYNINGFKIKNMKYEDVELKKEKDRDIMGMMPSSLIRISFTILTIIICLLIIVGVLLYIRICIK